MKSVLFVVVSLFAQSLAAQSVLRLQHITVDDGLSQNSVYYIFQDSHGFMWFATGDGLNRYDGKEFRHYQSRLGDKASGQPADRTINSRIFEDRDSKLWMSSDAGIYFIDYRHNRSEVIRRLKGDPILGIPAGVDSDTLWAVAVLDGIYGISVNSIQYRFYPFTDKWQTNKDTVNPVTAAMATSAGVWAVDDAGLLYFDRKRHNCQRIMLTKGLNGISGLADGQLLLTTTDGIYIYNVAGNKSEFFPIKNDISVIPLAWHCCAEDTATHTLYLGASNSELICKLKMDTHTYEFINFQKSNINCLYIDRSQNLWIGTEGNGIYKLDIKPPKFFSYTPNLSNSQYEADKFMVKSIYRDEAGRVWLGTFDKGLIVCDFTTHAQRSIPLSLPADDQLVSTVMRDSSGCIVTTIGNRVVWLNPVSGKLLKQVLLPKVISFSPRDPIIYTLCEWKKGHYIAGTNLGLYTIAVTKSAAFVRHSLTFKNYAWLIKWIYCLHPELNGDIYIGERNGFLKIRMNSDTSCFVLDTGFAGLAIRHFYKSKNSPLLWLASEKGLIAYNETSRRCKVFDEREGLANSFLYGILAQNDSTLWVSTNRGICNVRVQYGGDTDIVARFVNYTTKDGLQSNEFNSGSYFRSADGTLFFGGISGVNWFNPEHVRPNSYKALPALADVSVNDSIIATDTAVYIRSLVLPYQRNTVGFSLRALEYTQPGQNQFCYKLEGLDKEWVFTANDKVRYANLQPGSYRFLLRVSNNEGVWTKQPLEIGITIQAPYWKTWWFLTLAVATLVSVLLLSVRMYVRQKVAVRTRELEKQQALYRERLRISKDVHDDLGSGLSKISLMADMAQKKAGGNMSVSADIEHISAVSRELVDNMRDLIWVLNPENTTLEQLVAHMREYCSDYLENIPVDVTLDFPLSVPALRVAREAQRNIFLAAKEAVNNCIKHACATEIKITLYFDADKIVISIRDNGKGFKIADTKAGGNGLRNMKQRIETMGGTFVVASDAAGTLVEMTVPLLRLSE